MYQRILKTTSQMLETCHYRDECPPSQTGVHKGSLTFELNMSCLTLQSYIRLSELHKYLLNTVIIVKGC